ncbi:MAG TPA: response regulator [Azospirillaceae bacterium]|nr:response regulator [Azospirillaceae bacterium]HRQ79722.1 response regulator [Azospirillaceae bacterium]
MSDAPNSIQSKRVLVIDDGITMRLFYRTILNAADFEVEEATNGVEGFEKVVGNSYDLLIVDINMPKMDGYTMLRSIRREPGIGDVPAVTISTEAAESDSRKAFESGANFYLVKPVPPDTLTEVARLMTGMTK